LFFFRHNELHPLCVKIKDVLFGQTRVFYDRGVRRFYTGCSEGAGIWAGEAVLTLRKEYGDAELVCVLPCEANGGDRLQRLLSGCQEIKTVSHPGDSNAGKKCGRYLAERCDILIAVYDDSYRPKSDARRTADYAKKLSRDILFIHPETADVSLHRKRPEA
jgi:uncharacterized phage-like protein YoqJ